MYDILNVYLENGLRVIMHKIPHVRTMSCGVWIKQGSKHEDDNNGLVPDGLSLHEKIKLHYYGDLKHNNIKEKNII